LQCKGCINFKVRDCPGTSGRGSRWNVQVSFRTMSRQPLIVISCHELNQKQYFLLQCSLDWEHLWEPRGPWKLNGDTLHLSAAELGGVRQTPQNQLTRCFIRRIIPQLKQKYVVPLHSLFVKPSLIRIRKDFIGFVLIMRENDIGRDQILRVNGPEVAHCEGTVLDWCRDRSPYAGWSFSFRAGMLFMMCY